MNSVRTLQETPGNTLRRRYKARPVNAVRGTVAVYCENYTEHIHTLCTQNVEF
jgi:hypothetical protein